MGNNCSIFGNIGRYCSISDCVTVVVGRHPVRTFVSTSPVFYQSKNVNKCSYVNEQKFDEYSYADPGKKVPVIIGNDVWIGFGVTIIEGVTIGDGSIIAAGAVVSKDVMPYSIMAGVPAKPIGHRFMQESIDWLLEVKWWNYDDDYISRNAECFSSIDKLRNLFGTEKDKVL